MGQIDVANAVGAVNEAQYAEILAKFYQRLPREANSREGRYYVEHGHFNSLALFLDQFHGIFEFLHNFSILYRIRETDTVSCERRSLLQRLKSL